MGLSNPAKESYLVRDGDQRVGLLIIDMTGPLPGYLRASASRPAPWDAFRRNAATAASPEREG